MANAAIIFNGIQYGFNVVERAVAWAKQSGGHLTCIFLRAKDEVAEGYIFPSDLDAAEDRNTTNDATSSHGAVIISNVRMLEHLLQSEHISFTTEVLTDPSPSTLTAKLAGNELIFISDKIYETGILSVDSIDLRSWLKHVQIPFELINTNA